MGSKNKLRRFRENEKFPNVIQPSREEIATGFTFKGRWFEYFGNKNPIVLELGCGKGEYTVALAQQNPESNFIGIDIKGARFWRGARTCLEEGIKNTAFLRSQIQNIEFLFTQGEISEIWITFPDPQIKFRRSKHRLTHPAFLKRYQKILKAEGKIHLKTDSEFLHGYTLGLLENPQYELLYAHHNIYNNPHVPDQAVKVQTFYEKKFLDIGKPITYLIFKFTE